MCSMDEKQYKEWMERWDKHDPIGAMLHRAMARGEAKIDISDANDNDKDRAGSEESLDKESCEP